MRAGGKSRGVPTRSSLPERNSFHRGVQVILFGGIDVSCRGVERDFEVLLCQDAASLAELGEHPKTSVLLVDLAFLSDSNRSQLLKHIGGLHTALALAFSDSTDGQSCEQLLRMGFVGVLRLDESAETLNRAICAVADGQLWFPRETISRVLKGFLIPSEVNRLTAREVEILTLIGSGLNNQQIADKLFIARETVRWHLRGLYSKLGVKGRPGAQEYVKLLSGVRKAMPAKSAANGEGGLHSLAG
jgi:DNA-binding NarL/FixJ family response regulator